LGNIFVGAEEEVSCVESAGFEDIDNDDNGNDGAGTVKDGGWGKDCNPDVDDCRGEDEETRDGGRAILFLLLTRLFLLTAFLPPRFCSLNDFPAIECLSDRLNLSIYWKRSQTTIN